MQHSLRPVNSAAESSADEERHLRQDLAAAYRLAAHFGWDDLTNTHISVRIPGPEHHFLINPFDLMFEEITASSLLKIDLRGNLVAPSSGVVNKAGFTIHSAIHAERPDAKCIVHLHTVHGIGIGAQPDGMLPISAHALFLYGRTGYHDYQGVVIDESEVPRMLRALGSHAALFLRNHGTLAVGATIAEAFYNIYVMQRACEIQAIAMAGGGKPVMQPQAVADHMQKQIADNFQSIYDMTWAALVRMIERRDPGFRN